MHRYLNPYKYYRFVYEIFGPKPEVAFLHIPKTGGTYVNQYQSGGLPVIWPIKYYNHSVVISENDEIELINYPPKGLINHRPILHGEISEYFAFTAVRNIFSWFVSYYNHVMWGDKKNKYNIGHHDHKDARKGFGYLLRKISEREYVWPCRKFIFFQNFSYDGNLVPDYIARQEFLDDDLEFLANKFNLKYKKKEPQMVGKIKKDYREYYDDSLIKLVQNTWGEELDLWGYDFNGVKDSKFVGKILNKENKESVKYFWEDNKLILR